MLRHFRRGTEGGRSFNRTHLDRPSAFEHRAAGRQLHGLLQIQRLDDDEAEQGPSVTTRFFPRTTFPSGLSGWPGSFRCPLASRSRIQVSHDCRLFCARSGVPIASRRSASPARKRNMKSLIACPPDPYEMNVPRRAVRASTLDIAIAGHRVQTFERRNRTVLEGERLDMGRGRARPFARTWMRPWRCSQYRVGG